MCRNTSAGRFVFGIKMNVQWYKHYITLLSLIASAQAKNFAKENVHKIKEIQRANREKQRESSSNEPVKAVYKPGKFDHVDSRVAQEIKVCGIILSSCG